MINKKGAAPLIIGGVSVGAIIYLIFQIWAGSLIINALEPELNKMLDDLNEKAICPPEFNSESYGVCFNGKGEVILTGNVIEGFSIETDSGDSLYVSSGKYDSSIIGNLNELNKANKLILTGKSIQTSSISSLQLIKYSKDISYLRKPIKTGILFWKKIKYIPL